MGGQTSRGYVSLSAVEFAAKKKKLKNALLIFAWIQAMVTAAIVFLTFGSFIWTRTELPASSVPWYSGPTWRSDLWKAEHVMMMLRVPLFLIPACTAFTYAAKSSSRAVFMVHIIFCLVLLVIHNVMNLIWDSIRWGRCEEWPVCTGESGSPSTPKWEWYFVFFGNVLVMVLTMILLLIAARLNKLHITQLSGKKTSF